MRYYIFFLIFLSIELLSSCRSEVEKYFVIDGSRYYFNDNQSFSGMNILLPGFKIIDFANITNSSGETDYSYFRAGNDYLSLNCTIFIYKNCIDSAICFKRICKGASILTPGADARYNPWLFKMDWDFSGLYPCALYEYQYPKSNTIQMQKHCLIFSGGECYHVIISKDEYKDGDMEIIDKVVDTIRLM